MWAPWKPHEKFNHSVPAYLWYVVEPVLSSRPASTLTHNINKFWISFLIFLTFLTGLTRFWNDLIILGFIWRNILRYCLENSKGAERVKSSADINCQAAPDGCHPHCRGIRLFYFGIQYIIMSLVLILSPYP